MWEGWEVWEDGEEIFPPKLPTPLSLHPLPIREKFGSSPYPPASNPYSQLW
ncbi:hypothetical protein H6G74_30165 [Nostoc spongiaeforme FACHB-130]|uniref:Uncharacterized protein n=1 Tax=Nostoc spongiaeforme FACHB-130 TaxID=1357510 RepID=A0ABR8G5H7_9NOSO|nr:hypothetical protein [Nostoc spongiaeforme FACHB-130]